VAGIGGGIGLGAISTFFGSIKFSDLPEKIVSQFWAVFRAIYYPRQISPVLNDLRL
jgi:hypothetical protein